MVESVADYSVACFIVVLLAKALDAWWFQWVVMAQPRATAAAGIAALPILLLNTALPFVFDRRYCSPSVFAHITAVLTWVCSFKVIAYVSGRGPRFPNFMTYWEVFGALVTPAMLSLPMDEPRPHKKTDGDSGSGVHSKGGNTSIVVLEEGTPSVETIVRSHLKLLALYSSLLAAIAVALKRSAALGLPTWLVQALYGVGFMCFHLCTHVPWELVSSLMAHRPAIHNAWRPWAPESMADFWGCRWNRTASAILRWVVYEPIATGKLRVLPGTNQLLLLRTAPAWRRLLAALSTFAVSGAVHELIWHSMTGRFLGWFLVYFVGNGVVVLAEGLLRQHLFKRAQPRCGVGRAGQGPAAAMAPSNGKQSNGSHSNGSHANGSPAANRVVQQVLLRVVFRVARSLAVFAVVIVLGGWVIWPRLAASIGESFLGQPGMTFQEMHLHLMS